MASRDPDPGERETSLLLRYEEGTLTAAEEDELVALLRASPEGRRRLVEHAVLTGELATRLGDRAWKLPALDDLGSARTRRRRRLLWGTAVTALGAAAGLALWLSPRPPPRDTAGVAGPVTQAPAPSAPPIATATAAIAALPRLVSASGPVFVLAHAQRRPAVVDQRLSDGEGLLTVGERSAARLAYDDGTTVELGPASGLAQIGTRAGVSGSAGKSLFLTHGRLSAQAARQPAGAPLVFSTPHADATVVGTRLSLAVTGELTRLDVEEGRVRLASVEAGAIEVGAGRSGLARRGSAPVLAELPRGGRVLFVTGAPRPGAADQAVKARLERAGFEVQMALPGMTSLIADAQASRLVVVSSTTSSRDLATAFRELPVPLLTWESSLYDDLGMTGACADGECGTLAGLHSVFIQDPTHPLAAGLSGLVRFHDGAENTINWGRPSVFAAWVGRESGGTRALLFAYERGATMPGLVAPARRVGIFLGDATATGLTDAGWNLFDAAVTWCAGDPGR